MAPCAMENFPLVTMYMEVFHRLSVVHHPQFLNGEEFPDLCLIVRLQKFRPFNIFPQPIFIVHNPSSAEDNVEQSLDVFEFVLIFNGLSQKEKVHHFVNSVTVITDGLTMLVQFDNFQKKNEDESFILDEAREVVIQHCLSPEC